MRLRAMATVPLLLVWSACRSECRDGESWCEGTRVMACRRVPHGDVGAPGPKKYHAEQYEDCARMDLACFQNGTTAACAIAEQTCDPARSSFCLDDQVMHCHASGHPRVFSRCRTDDRKTGGVCLERDAGAICAGSPEPCEGDFFHCFDGTLSHCSEGVWVAQGDCGDRPDGGT